MRFLVLSFLFLFSINASATCSTSDSHKIHDVVFIHGIASNKGAFGHWAEYLKKYHPNECINSHFFEYDTGNNKLNLEDFIQSFDSYMHKNFEHSNSKITIVAHSQGGLITMFWLKSMDEAQDPIRHRVKNIMTMATPYYGAIIANLGYSLGTFVLPILGKKELKNMKIGSKKVVETLEFFKSSHFKDIISDKNFVTISATLAPSIFDIEGDFAVAPFSSNPNIKNEQEVSTHYNIDGVHLRFRLFGTPATTLVSKYCLISPARCENSSLAIFEKEFLGNQKVKINYAKDINSFAVYLRTKEKGPFWVHSNNIQRGLRLSFIHIRDDLYFYKGYLIDGDTSAELIVSHGNRTSVIEVNSGQTSYLTH
ncbi:MULTISPECIES: esterase/lipase family protein [unclassified Halobacteriovorax]|uniref:esterase/lipase family protein n=1 Tax=unclassified Halobacteriovorax TaxID=2639665 RepID=UPI00399AEB85